jgi:CheY-like chemotaxis protein
VKFTDRGGVTLRVTQDTDPAATRLRFEVADSGIGVDEAQQGLLFQRFSQIRRSGDRPRGAGLGLAISRQLVEAMGGAIGVRSRAGAGSVFWFTIPCVETQAPAGMAGEAAPRAGARRRLLVAEDQYMVRELLETILTEAGHEVVLVKNGIEAIEAIASGDFDLVLMDVEMPEMDGIEAMRRIRQMGERVRNIPIIALTAYAMAEDVERSRAAGANLHLSKPVKRNALLQAIARCTGKEEAAAATAPNGSLPPPIIDAAILKDLDRHVGRVQVARLFRIFRDQLQETMTGIAATADRGLIAQQAHALVSLAGHLGCTELMIRSRALMEAARRETGALEPLVAELRAAADRALSAIHERNGLDEVSQ